ncbi:ABC transporter permease [Lacipirellula sp.]|uniref:ABC transporter permease n=1 Tax=Lacipirellula sp. TaxID=2691419 RepID=UPI003D1007BD
MTTFSAAAETVDASPRASGWARAWNAAESRLAAIADRANPILVKETRQALKSRQFIITFLVVLLGCWIVSFVGIAVVGPQIYFAAAGPGMLAAYYTILIGPLTLIVPFTAFRSLAAEQEENTFDLLSITALGSRQIVTGKLTSSLVQMVVYLSAVSPCIAFTFLLRGVDAVTVAVLMIVAVLASVGLSMIALLVGAIARVRNSQVIISVALVLALAGACWGMWVVGIEIISSGSATFRDPEFLNVAVMLLAFYVATFGIIHAAAAAQVAFVSENRSTPLRWWMMGHQACLVGALGGLAVAVRSEDPVAPQLGNALMIIGCTFGAGYWYLMGSLMTGEWPHLSRRVQRSLPTSALGRPFFSLLNPGPGSGYLFAVANLSAIILFGLTAMILLDDGGNSGRPSTEQAVYFAIFAWSYVVAFLGFGCLIISVLRKWVFVPMTAAFLVHAVLFLAAIGVPTVIQMTSRELRNSGYTLWQITNPVWTLSELANKSQGVDNVQAGVLIYILPTAAIIALMFNMRAIGTELLLQRIPVPVRIVEDEAELKAATSRGPSSPWDVDDEDATPSTS